MADLEKDVIVKPFTEKPVENIVHPFAISVGITWIDGRIVFKPNKKWAQARYGICHYGGDTDNIDDRTAKTGACALITPLDWDKATAITTVYVALPPKGFFCSRSTTCLHFDCHLNQFRKDSFIDMFGGDCTGFTLGLPSDLGTKPFPFNSPQYRLFWGKLIKNLRPEGGVLMFKED